MITLTVLINKPQSPFYEQLLDKVDDQLLHLQDARGIFYLDKIHEKILNHYIRNIAEKPWNNHLLLAIYVDVDKNLDVQTIRKSIVTIHPRLNNIFESFHLNSMKEFDVERHLYEYLKGSIYQEHSDVMRSICLSCFKAVSYGAKKWILSKLNNEQQTYFEQYLIPMPSYDSRDFSFTKSAKEQAQNTRKNETDVIVPLLPKIRAEAHFRWNQLNRLRQAFLKACKQAKSTNCELPLDFHYDEPERIGERFYFRLWDKSSFVLMHQDQFPASSIKAASKRTGAYSEDNNHFFVEFIKAERYEDDEEAEVFWFMELFEKGVIGQWVQNTPEKEHIYKRTLLNSWGYGEEGSTKNPEPFDSRHKGILTPSTFISLNQDKAKEILLDIEPLYAGATFGLLALNIFTTTGARINELLQLSNTKECIRTVKVDNKVHYSFYAVPKGRDELEPFYISEQTMKLIQSVVKLLKEHYGTEKIPSVKYRHTRSHLFPKDKPYFFQYYQKALRDQSISSCIRFLLHGLNFETQEGKLVVIKTHLLRHAFATEAAQRQGISMDILAKILHHRDIDATQYYSEPTQSQVAQAMDDYHDITADHIDIDEAVLRNPEELEERLEEYKQQVGVFNNVLGGTCVTDYVCPIKMQCIGCHAKIPQPEKKHELEEAIELSKDMEKRYAALNLTVEVKKARAMRKQAKNELKEIALIEKYREEQKYEPHIEFNK